MSIGAVDAGVPGDPNIPMLSRLGSVNAKCLKAVLYLCFVDATELKLTCYDWELRPEA